MPGTNPLANPQEIQIAKSIHLEKYGTASSKQFGCRPSPPWHPSTGCPMQQYPFCIVQTPKIGRNDHMDFLLPGVHPCHGYSSTKSKVYKLASRAHLGIYTPDKTSIKVQDLSWSKLPGVNI